MSIESNLIWITIVYIALLFIVLFFLLWLSYILDISCQIQVLDDPVKSADDKPTSTDEEDIITIAEDVKVSLISSHTKKGDSFVCFSVVNNLVI